MLTLSRVCTLLRVYTRVHVCVCVKFEVRMQVGGMLALKAERNRGATGGKPLERNRGATGRKPLTWRHEQQGDAAPASLLKKPVTKKDANDDSEDDDFYDRTASRAKVPLCPLPLNFQGPRFALRSRANASTCTLSVPVWHTLKRAASCMAAAGWTTIQY